MGTASSRGSACGDARSSRGSFDTLESTASRSWLPGPPRSFPVLVSEASTAGPGESLAAAAADVERSDCSVVAPGLVNVRGLPGSYQDVQARGVTDDPRLDPTWALQVLPAVKVVHGESISLLAKAALEHIHELGMVHRSVTLESLLVRPGGVERLEQRDYKREDGDERAQDDELLRGPLVVDADLGVEQPRGARDRAGG